MVVLEVVGAATSPALPAIAGGYRYLYPLGDAAPTDWGNAADRRASFLSGFVDLIHEVHSHPEGYKEANSSPKIWPYALQG